MYTSQCLLEQSASLQPQPTGMFVWFVGQPHPSCLCNHRMCPSHTPSCPSYRRLGMYYFSLDAHAFAAFACIAFFGFMDLCPVALWPWGLWYSGGTGLMLGVRSWPETTWADGCCYLCSAITGIHFMLPALEHDGPSLCHDFATLWSCTVCQAKVQGKSISDNCNLYLDTQCFAPPPRGTAAINHSTSEWI